MKDEEEPCVQRRPFHSFYIVTETSSTVFPSVGNFSFSSSITFAASQAFQKMAGEFILCPNTVLQYFYGNLSLAGCEK